MEKSKLYTRTGDNGTTSLVGGQRVAKNSVRLEAYGTVDELNSAIGLILAAAPLAHDDREFLTYIQSRLFDLGSYLATDSQTNAELAASMFPSVEKAISRLESEIDRLDAAVEPMRNFVLPQGAPSAAAAHLARTIARRTERRVLDLAAEAHVDPLVVKFVNRLSDYLFILARFNNHLANCDEIIWIKDC